MQHGIVPVKSVVEEEAREQLLRVAVVYPEVPEGLAKIVAELGEIWIDIVDVHHIWNSSAGESVDVDQNQSIYNPTQHSIPLKQILAKASPVGAALLLLLHLVESSLARYTRWRQLNGMTLDAYLHPQRIHLKLRVHCHPHDCAATAPLREMEHVVMATHTGDREWLSTRRADAERQKEEQPLVKSHGTAKPHVPAFTNRKTPIANFTMPDTLSCGHMG
ncbi:hypothetical protein FAVG1_12825 [Fusarium avenaceum]|nr:hypothetical protein FAVG1_12825 [Fusarium avenaceum]